METTATKPDYGIDAPVAIRNLAIAGTAALLVLVAVAAGWLPKSVSPQLGSVVFHFPLRPMATAGTIGFLGMASWMFFEAKYGKIAEREKLLDRIAWRGDERVLDAGCGRGLLLVGAAKRAKNGSALGVDIWRTEDLSGNSAEIPMRNAAIEGVADRVEVKTADLRELPLPDASFDVIVSLNVIHNIDDAAGRVKAVAHLARVLKPGGRAIIGDIRHLREYARAFRANGCAETRMVDSQLGSAFFTLMSMGRYQPNTLVVRKAE